MRTRSRSYPNNNSSTIPRRNRRRSQQQVPPNLVEPPKDTMADQRTMAELLQAPTEGYEDAIVVPAITADNFELKHGLLTLVQNKQFFGHDKEDPHAHIRYFNNITSTLKFPNVLNTSVKLLLFPFSLKGEARIWLEKEPPRPILTWDDLAWDRFKDLLRACPHHGFSELYQLDTFYNALNTNDQDSLNSSAGGNFLDKRPCNCLCIIERKSKVRQSRSKAIVSKVSTSTSASSISPDVAELKDMVKALLLDKQKSQAPATIKAVEESCVTCGGAHSYRNCPATDGNNYRDNIQEYVSQAAAVNYNQGNTGYRPPNANQVRPLGFPPVQNNHVPPNLVEPPKDTMADQRTMAELLQAPTEGYEDAIVVPAITADNFELKHGLLTLVQNKQFFGHDKEDPHAHIRYFNKITSTLKFPNVPNTSVKLMLFPFSLEGAARIWLEKEPPRSILTWDDLVSKFINNFFPPSKTTNLRNEITNFQQRFDESFSEAWDRFKDLLRACPHHGFSELHQLDTFYNALNTNDQDSLNSAAGGNFLDKRPRDCLCIIESKSKVRQSRSKAIVSKVSTSTSASSISPDVAELKDMVKALLLDKQKSQAPATIKAVEESCVTCGGAHSYRNCPATDGNNYRDNIQEYVSQAATVNYNQGNTGYRPPNANQVRPPGFPPV
ncbi:reverse transcriptase domain-containing protein [Tanacetum coccineum]